jgi:hypothetical protein
MSVLSLGVGLGVLLMGVGILVVCAALAKLFARVQETLDEVNRQIAALSPPVVDMLGHVGGIAGTADATVAHFGAIAGTLEGIAGNREIGKRSDRACIGQSRSDVDRHFCRLAASCERELEDLLSWRSGIAAKAIPDFLLATSARAFLRAR